ncbi:helicase C-terminal domain-containing protein, partial [Erwinia amylovora]|uniref:helicase C-terminal domain-containing protein n=1 Tax=Erwinia amylovora TaxID=552 RepID=UPI0034A35C8B|nr:ATP-dependent DNA helicase DinG [Erwinia amylovora]
ILKEGEWLKSLKRYPFEVQSLPSASFNLIQQVWRLILRHDCFGEIVIYDRRLINKRSGARLLGALPVFPIEQPQMPHGELQKATAAAVGKKTAARRRRSPT